MYCGRPSKASGRTQVEFSPKMKGATETTRVWPFLHRFFAKICQEKNTIRSFTIISSMGTQWRKGLSLPRRRLWEYSWKVVCQRAAESWETDIERRYEIGFQASMKCTWATHGQSLDCSLWMDYWVRFCEAFTSIRLWPGRTQTDPYLCQPFDCNNKMGGLLWEEGLGLLASPNCLISGKCRLVKIV